MAYRDDLQAALLRADAAERRAKMKEEKAVEKKVRTTASALSRLRVWWSWHWGDLLVTLVLSTLALLFVAACVGMVYDAVQSNRARAACASKLASLTDQRVDAYVRDLYPDSTVSGRHCAHGEGAVLGYVPCSVVVIPKGQSAPVRVDVWCSFSCDEGRGCRAAGSRP